VATFECATIDEFNECMAIVRDNEPSSVSFTGSQTFIPPDEDLTPPHGISRSAAFAKAAERADDAEWRSMTHDIFVAMKRFAEFRGPDGRANFIGFTGELARDAWSDAWGGKS
jgi:hypothetical protein